MSELLIYAVASFVVGWLLPAPKLPGGGTPAQPANPLRDILIELLKQRLGSQVAAGSKAAILDDETKALLDLLDKKG